MTTGLPDWRINKMKEALATSMLQQTFTITVNVQELFTEFVPKLAREYVRIQGAKDELRDTELKLTLDISGDVYSYMIRDGIKITVTEGDIDNPQVRISFSLENLARFAEMKNIDMLLGMQKQLTRKKLASLSDLKGTGVFQLNNPDNSISEITATFNNADNPRAILKLSMQEAYLINTGKESPLNLFMSGKMKIEGDIGFAIKMQSLFVD